MKSTNTTYPQCLSASWDYNKQKLYTRGFIGLLNVSFLHNFLHFPLLLSFISVTAPSGLEFYFYEYCGRAASVGTRTVFFYNARLANHFLFIVIKMLFYCKMLAWVMLRPGGEVCRHWTPVKPVFSVLLIANFILKRNYECKKFQLYVSPSQFGL